MSADAVFAVLLAAIAIIAVLARMAGSLSVKIHQPPVVGEIMLGIALGPTLLGLVLPGGSASLLPPDAASHLKVIAQFGLVMFMFLIGLEFDRKLIRGRRTLATAISFSSVALPLGLGTLLAAGSRRIMRRRTVWSCHSFSLSGPRWRLPLFPFSPGSSETVASTRRLSAPSR